MFFFSAAAAVASPCFALLPSSARDVVVILLFFLLSVLHFYIFSFLFYNFCSLLLLFMHVAVIKTYICSALQHFLVRKRIRKKYKAEFARCPAGRRKRSARGGVARARARSPSPVSCAFGARFGLQHGRLIFFYTVCSCLWFLLCFSCCCYFTLWVCVRVC